MNLQCIFAELQRRNSDQDQQEDEQEHRNLPAAFSPIPEPPEPAIPAPGRSENFIENLIGNYRLIYQQKIFNTPKITFPMARILYDCPKFVKILNKNSILPSHSF